MILLKIIQQKMAVITTGVITDFFATMYKIQGWKMASKKN